MQRSTDHPRLVKLVEVHETLNTVYLIMEYFDGRPIIDLENLEKIDPKRATYFIFKVVEVP